MFRPPTKYSEYLQDVRKSIDYILKRVNAKYVSKIVAGSNITISPSDGTGVVTISADIDSTGYYGAFSDYTNQTAAAINTGYPMRLGVTDLNNEVTIQSNSRITFNFAGKYNLQWSGQFVNPDTQEHDVRVWLRKNGTDVTGSTGLVSVASRHGGIDGHVLPAWNYVVEASANDYYEFVWSTSSTQVYLASNPATAFSPSTASVIVTATPVIAGGSGSEYLSDLMDVNISLPTEGQFLAYNATTGLWENVTADIAPGSGELDIDGGTFLVPGGGFNFDGGSFT
jgi:hypothetical protein